MKTLLIFLIFCLFKINNLLHAGIVKAPPHSDSIIKPFKPSIQNLFRTSSLTSLDDIIQQIKAIIEQNQ